MKASFTITTEPQCGVCLVAENHDEALVLDRLRELIAEQSQIPFDAELGLMPVRKVDRLSIG